MSTLQWIVTVLGLITLVCGITVSSAREVDETVVWVGMIAGSALVLILSTVGAIALYST